MSFFTLYSKMALIFKTYITVKSIFAKFPVYIFCDKIMHDVELSKIQDNSVNLKLQSIKSLLMSFNFAGRF